MNGPSGSSSPSTGFYVYNRGNIKDHNIYCIFKLDQINKNTLSLSFKRGNNKTGANCFT
jgi:hypothetical protein